MAIGSALGILYLLVVIGTAVLVLWALVLLIVFLQLRIAQLRSEPGGNRTVKAPGRRATSEQHPARQANTSGLPTAVRRR